MASIKSKRGGEEMKPTGKYSERHYKYDLYDYEIWGNAKDGFQVNNVFFAASDVVLSESIVMDDWKLIKALKQLGIIKKGIHAKSIDIDGEADFTLYFNDARDGCPAFELRCTAVYGDDAL
jgi:hypothetical protein